MIDTLTNYRQGVVGIIQNSNNEFLIVQNLKFKDNEWKFPSGGIEEGETPEEALKRELFEELGTDKFEIIEKSPIINQFNWSEETIKNQGFKYRGQQQTQFLVKFTGNPEDIKPSPKEIKAIKWVKREDLKTYFLFPNQWKIAEKTLSAFTVLTA